MQIPKVVYQVGRVLRKNSPAIFTGLGIAGAATSIVMAVKATPKAMNLIDRDLYSRFLEDNTEDAVPSFDAFILTSNAHGVDAFRRLKVLSPKESIMIAYEPYLPAAGMFLMSTAFIIFAQRINIRRQAVLASLYSIAETSLREYQEKVTETIGTKKEALIRGEVAQDHITKHVATEENTVDTGRGDTLFYDELSGRYFISDLEDVRKAENKFNQELLATDVTKSLNELYYEMGLESIGLGEHIGWDVNKGLVELIFSAKLTLNDRPCIVIDYKKFPEGLWL